jgi:hypothetical protein
MGIIGRNTLRTLLRDLEREAQRTVDGDASFLEALQNLKREVDGDPRVKAVIRAFQAQDLAVASSFDPRIRIRLHMGETIVAVPEPLPFTRESYSQETQDEFGSEAATEQLRDAANAVVGASPLCQELDRIVNEALRANPSFEQLAAGLERAGYELHICLDLSLYARVSNQPPYAAPAAERKVMRNSRRAHPQPASAEPYAFPLSSQDLEFLKRMKISP